MSELIQSGGWLMVPIIICSVIAIAIIIDRFWSLRPSRISPPNLLPQTWSKIKNNEFSKKDLKALQSGSPLGQIMSAGIASASGGRSVMTESVEQAASHVIHDMERYLNSLGTIATITPLLGLLGTVIGMIKVFNEIMSQGTGNASLFAGGISEALITTAAGLIVSIPALMFYRMFVRRIETLVVELERESIKLVDALYTSGDVVISAK